MWFIFNKSAFPVPDSFIIPIMISLTPKCILLFGMVAIILSTSSQMFVTWLQLTKKCSVKSISKQHLHLFVSEIFILWRRTFVSYILCRIFHCKILNPDSLVHLEASSQKLSLHPHLFSEKLLICAASSTGPIWLCICFLSSFPSRCDKSPFFQGISYHIVVQF